LSYYKFPYPSIFDPTYRLMKRENLDNSLFFKNNKGRNQGFWVKANGDFESAKHWDASRYKRKNWELVFAMK